MLRVLRGHEKRAFLLAWRLYASVPRDNNYGRSLVPCVSLWP